MLPKMRINRRLVARGFDGEAPTSPEDWQGGAGDPELDAPPSKAGPSMLAQPEAPLWDSAHG